MGKDRGEVVEGDHIRINIREVRARLRSGGGWLVICGSGGGQIHCRHEHGGFVCWMGGGVRCGCAQVSPSISKPHRESCFC